MEVGEACPAAPRTLAARRARLRAARSAPEAPEGLLYATAALEATDAPPATATRPLTSNI
eukprot:scaffold56263_cov72-Phaeocystis_antarctica.AAC.1